MPRFLGELQADLRAKTYKPLAVRRVYIKQLVGRHRNGVKDVRVLIRDLNPVSRAGEDRMQGSKGHLAVTQHFGVR